MERLPGAQQTEDVVWLLLFIRALVHLCSWTHQEYCWIECESKKRTLDIFIFCVASRLGQRTFISCISSSSTFFVPPRNGLLLRYDDGISWMSANARVFIYMCVCVWWHLNHVRISDIININIIYMYSEENCISFGVRPSSLSSIAGCLSNQVPG